MILLKLALADPGMAIEKDYYRKAIAWDATQADAARSDALHWHVTTALQPGPSEQKLSLNLLDDQQHPVQADSVTVAVLHNGHAAHVERLTLQSAGGHYVGDLHLKWRGLHEIRVTAQRGTQAFATTLRADWTW